MTFTTQIRIAEKGIRIMTIRDVETINKKWRITRDRLLARMDTAGIPPAEAKMHLVNVETALVDGYERLVEELLKLLKRIERISRPFTAQELLEDVARLASQPRRGMMPGATPKDTPFMKPMKIAKLAQDIRGLQKKSRER